MSGTYDNLRYDGINVIPLLEQERILFTISTDDGELKQIAEVCFSAKDQTPEKFDRIMKQVVGEKLMMLL